MAINCTVYRNNSACTNSGGGLTTGGIIGIAVGLGVSLIIIIIFLIYYCCCGGRKTCVKGGKRSVIHVRPINEKPSVIHINPGRRTHRPKPPNDHRPETNTVRPRPPQPTPTTKPLPTVDPIYQPPSYEQPGPISVCEPPPYREPTPEPPREPEPEPEPPREPEEFRPEVVENVENY